MHLISTKMKFEYVQIFETLRQGERLHQENRAKTTKTYLSTPFLKHQGRPSDYIKK